MFGGVGANSPAPEANGDLGQSPQTSEAGVQGRGTRVWGRSPKRSKILHFFSKNNLTLDLSEKNLW